MLKVRPVIIILAIMLAVSASYVSSLNGVFLFDDYTAIVNNPSIIGEKSIPVDTRMLVNLTFRLQSECGLITAADFHLINIIIHISAALFLFGLVRRTIILCGRDADDLDALLFSSFCAVAWGVHPMTTQAVTYICQRYESMMGMFILASLYFFARALSSGPDKRLYYNLSLASCLLGAFCKEVMVSAPLVILAYDYVYSGRGWRDIWSERKAYYIALFLIDLVVVVLWLGTVARTVEMGLCVASTMGRAEYLMHQSMTVMVYLKAVLYPAELCFDYGHIAATAGMLMPHLLMAGFLLVSALLLLARKRTAGFLGAAFFLLLAPTSVLIPLPDVIVEHRMYLPLACAVVLVAAGIKHVTAANPHGGAVFSVLMLGLCLALGLMTYSRNIVYHSEESMWRDVVDRRPGNLRARNDLAISLSQSGRYKAAMEEYERVLHAIPSVLRMKLDAGEQTLAPPAVKDSFEYEYFRANVNMGVMEYSLRKDLDSAIYRIGKALKVMPWEPNAVLKYEAMVNLRNQAVVKDVGGQ